MEELKLLVESIAGLPDLAIWVVAMYFVFKLVIVGSIYGVIRFVTFKVWDWAKTRKESKLVTIESVRDTYKIYDVSFDKHLISGVEERAYNVVKNILRDCQNNSEFKYIHRHNIDDLEAFAIAYKEHRAKDK